ncbi:riboflavin biosynthesis protein RibF, partial [bacterium]|nr:riboflavin biosynthesis protein RibF [bacterium]
MQFFRHRSPPITQGAAVTIGNFDGIHRGHQAMLYRLRDWAQRIGTPTVVVSFDPTPQQYFGTPVPRLSRFRAKWTALEEIGIHYFWCRRFDRILASQSAEDFIQQELVQKLKIRYLLVGEHFRFGRERQGDTALLTAAAAQYGFVFETIPLLQDPMPISSTAIRQALSAGDCAQAAQWLGRPYSLLGRVVHGSKRGRSIGFPTANIPCPNPPVRGVFIVWLQTPDQQWYAGVANVGRRPTF